LIDPDWLQAIRLIPGWYLRYFYYSDEVFEEDRRSLLSKGEQDMLAEEKIRQIYATSGYNSAARQILEAKGGAQYYLPVLQVIDSIIHDRGEVVVVDVRNGNTLPDLPPEVCVEVPARIHRESIDPLRYHAARRSWLVWPLKSARSSLLKQPFRDHTAIEAWY
jgi:6-phospho-beta-glucosidase